ncbi:hypothetical protein [Tumebacillus permanentifrigoris]|uniref:Uncharacterized protein n=1 Tax=Tumebacillus permanentifrigoris TaxID=378543 RepID=A0A316D6N4_9BACL|nr:hypothetical protein [Tumebacillus permanentifrigoris]PWK07880.1 hypothetical protein C7459_11639 [Tumebacillus permanentifrigoris]
MKKRIATILAVSTVAGALGYLAWFTPSHSEQVIAAVQPKPETQQDKPDKMVVHGIVPSKTKAELVGESDVIIRGKVKELLPSKWSNPNWERGQDVSNVIQTDILVHVNDIFKGKPYDKDIAVRIDKGKVDNMTWESDGYPDFLPEENVVLFLRQDNSDLAKPQENYYILTGMFQGKFSQDLKHPEDILLHNGKDVLDPATMSEEISKEGENYKKLLKPTEPKGNI